MVGDGIDNDCDNKIDEELCDGTNTGELLKELCTYSYRTGMPTNG